MTSTSMYAGWNPAPTLAEHLPIDNVEAVEVLTPEVTCLLIENISKSLRNPHQVDQVYGNETGLSWILQPMSHSLLLPMEYKDSILQTLTIYRHWLSTLSGESIVEMEGLSMPAPVLMRPEKFAKIVLCHLPNLFRSKEYSGENLETDIQDHVKLCHLALRSIHCLGTGTGCHVLSQDAWNTLLSSLIEIGNIILPFPSQPKDLATDICTDFIRILFDLWIRSCGHYFPSPPLWNKLRESCLKWRHRRQVVTQWGKMAIALTKGVVLEMNSQRDSLDDSQTGRAISGIEWKDPEFRTADFYLDTEALYQCWYRFLQTIGNVVELSYPDVILKQFLLNDPSQPTEPNERHYEDLRDLPKIFWIALHSIDQHVDLFLSNFSKDTSPSQRESYSGLPGGPATPVVSRVRAAKTSSVPSSNKNIKTSSLSSQSIQNVNSTPVSRYLSPTLLAQSLSTAQIQAKVSSTSMSQFPSTKTTANTLLHIFGAWLFEACVWKYSENLNVSNSSQTFESHFAPSQIALEVFESQSKCSQSFETGRAEAFSALCKIFNRQPCHTTIISEYLARFYASIIRGLSFFPKVCTGEIATKILEEGSDLLRIDLKVSSLLLPHFLNMLEKILPPLKPPFILNLSQKNIIKLRAKAISILSSMTCFPLHFQHMPIADLSRFIPQINQESDPDRHGSHYTFFSLRDRINKLVFDAILSELDATNLCKLLCLLQLMLNDSASYDNALSRERNAKLKESPEDDTVNSKLILSSKQTYNIFVESCHITEKILIEWNFKIGNLEVVLAAFELLICVARIGIDDIDVNTRCEVLKSILEFILPAPKDGLEEPQYKQQTRNRHTQLVAAFNTAQQWLLAYPILLKEDVCLKILMEIIEIGLSGFPHQQKTVEGSKTTYKEDKVRGYPSTRVLEAASALLTTALELINSFPSPSGPEASCSLLNEESIIECLTPEAKQTSKFRYYALNNSIIIGLISGPFATGKDSHQSSRLPTVTMLLRCNTGKHVWTFQLRHFPRGKSVDPNLLVSAERPPLGAEPEVKVPRETTPWPEPDPSDGHVLAENSIPTVEDILIGEGLQEQNSSFLELVRLRGDVEKELETDTLKEKQNQPYPDPRLVAEPKQPKTEFQTDRLLLNSLGLLQTGHLEELDGNKEGFKRALNVVDSMSFRNNNTVFLLYVQSGRTNIVEVVDYKPLVMRNNQHFQGFLRSLGWPRDPTTHVGFRGKVPQDKSFFTPKLSAERPFLYYTDQLTEIAFVFPEPLESLGSSGSLMSSDSYESLNIVDAPNSYQQTSRTPPENISINTDPGSIPNSDKDSGKIRTPKRESTNTEDNTSNTSSTTANVEVPKLNLPIQREPTPSITQEMMMMTSGTEQSINPLSSGHMKVGGDGDPMGIKSTSRKKQKQHCGTIVVWLECFEDHKNFPLQQIVELFILDTFVAPGGKRRLNTSQSSLDRLTTTPPVIFVYRLQNGLFRIHRPGPMLPVSPITSSALNLMPAGPLLDGFVCGPRDLARMVRETTINICWERRLSGDEFSPPAFLRRRRIEDIVQLFKIPQDTHSKLLTRLFM